MSLMALEDDDDEIMGDSVCSTLSGCSLLDCDRGGGFHTQWGQLDHLPAQMDGDYAAAAELASDTHADHSREGVAANNDHRLFEHLADVNARREHEVDNGTYRSAVMRQFKDDIDRLVQTVGQKIESSRTALCGSSQTAAVSNSSSMYSAVKSSCLSLLLSRVLPPLLERFEQCLMGNLQTSGLLPLAPPLSNRQDASVADTTANESIASRSHKAPPPRPLPPPRPAPRLRSSAAELASTALPPPLLSPPTPPPPPSAAVRRVRQTQSQQYRVSSPFFVNQQHPVHAKAPSSLPNSGVTAPPAVRNNSSVKPPSPAAPSTHATLPLHRQRPQQPATHSTSISCSELVHTFLVRDSPSLREILYDPDDRKMKSVSQRFGCYISVYEKTRRAGHLLHKVMVKAPSEKALRMCINALDSGLNWDLASQLNRATKKSGGLVPSMAK